MSQIETGKAMAVDEGTEAARSCLVSLVRGKTAVGGSN